MELAVELAMELVGEMAVELVAEWAGVACAPRLAISPPPVMRAGLFGVWRGNVTVTVDRVLYTGAANGAIRPALRGNAERVCGSIVGAGRVRRVKTG
ncbi:MAG: hypothetical protein OD918_09180, partial [Gammaproteobacteria bacterium]